MRTALILAVLAAGCASHPRPAPRTAYDDAVMSGYCNAIWARGIADDQKNSCRSWYEAKSRQEREDANAEHRADNSRRHKEAVGAAFQALGQGLQQRQQTNCSSIVAGQAIYTNCY